jgi:acyl carrier protein phosphodiesterase
VNFFSHLVVARRVRRDPAFLLGAMLPDFATMSGSRLGAITHPDLAAGVAEHHHTDAAFHGIESFVVICREVGARLEARGLSWGAARAVAHVGTELFLDGELTRDEEAAEDYLAAIAAARLDALGGHVVMKDDAGTERFRRLERRLAEHGAPTRYREPSFVRDVLVRILEHRPRLAIAAEQDEVLLSELELLRARVNVERDALLGQTLAALGRAQPLGDQASQR